MGHDPSITPPHTHRVAENPASDSYGWMTASDRADDGTARLPTVRPFFLYRGLLATSHRSVHPRAPVRGKIHASHDRAVPERCARGRARAATDRPTGAGRGGARGGKRGRRRPDVASLDVDAGSGERARARDEEDVRARSRDDRRGRSRGGVGRRRENDGIGASETDATRCDATTARDDRRACVGGSARWGKASTRANAGAR